MGNRYASINGNATFVMQDLLQWREGGGEGLCHMWHELQPVGFPRMLLQANAFPRKSHEVQKKGKKNEIQETLRESSGKARLLLKYKLRLLTVFIADYFSSNI